MQRFVRSAALAAAGVLVAGLAVGCGGSSDGGGDGKGGSGGGQGRGAGKDLAAQKLDWGRCKAPEGGTAPGAQWQCSTLEVPLDHAKPDGETIGIALIRAKSTGKGDRIGSLVFNFGGPGGSGVSGLPSFGDSYAKLRERYDLVSFDPRGVAGSQGVRCRDDKATQAAERRIDLTPDTAAEEKAYFEDAADFGAGCARGAKKLIGHISTTDAARDLDLLRQVLGDDKLHYFGVSYGTELGGTYAHLFPKRVGRLTFDAVVDPTADSVGHAENQARGFQRALDNYFTSRGVAPEEGTAKVVKLLKKLDAEPMRTSGDRKLTESLASTGILVTLYSKQSWPTLSRALDDAEQGDGSTLLQLADAYNERDPSGRYGTQSHAQRAISCVDSKGRTTPEEAKKSMDRFREISPVFGEFLGWDTAGWCHDWPVAGLHDSPEVSAPGAAPILVVGNTGDPATPYEGARKMADELGKDVGVHLTWKGEGHGAYGNGSSCVDGTINDYLLDGKVPEDGKVCAS
ncbi:alpha/beta hydrolase [Streptomyces silaceus]|uniref:alpha/beta hydrolase n=1 Tax=Streptomyces silaceus TaxID=545123 RepID=UPI0006EB6D68|nr:alpha/beta hydrolase [Streptomyces silaceus]